MSSEIEVIFNQEKVQLQKIDSPPSLKETQVLVRPRYVGICGSDLHHLESYEGKELRIGHEWVGTIQEVGSKVQRIKPGDNITTSAVLPCLKCENCHQNKINFCLKPTILGSEKLGAMRSWIILDEKHAISLGQFLSPSLSLLEVVAVGEQAFKHAQKVEQNHQESKTPECLIIGAGSVGLCTALVAKSKGYEPTLIEVQPERVQRARDLNFKAFSLKKSLIDSSFDHAFSLIFDASGDHCSARGAWPFLTKFGKKEMVCVMIAKYTKAFQFSPNNLGLMAARLVWMRGVEYECFTETIKKWNNTELFINFSEKLITHQFNIESEVDVKQAFKKSQDQKGAGKVLCLLNESKD